MTIHTPARPASDPAEGFRAALIFYPSCSRLRDEEPAFKPYAPIRMFVAGEDKEVNPKTCVKFAHVVVEAGGPLQVIEFPEAHHDFDNPASKDAADKAAAAAARESAREFLAIELGS